MNDINVETQLKKYTNDFDFAKKMLFEVSRTFALNIGFLKGDLHKSVLLSYLFCRIIDTIEDSNILSFNEKIDALNLFDKFFPFSENWENDLIKFQNYASNDLTDNQFESILIRNSNRIFNEFKTLSPNLHEIISPWIKEMCLGMAKFQKMAMEEKRKPFTLKTVIELEEYCYYVAGTVGMMLKNLFFHFFPDIKDEQKKQMEENAISFGLGLQITNIIKDFRDDGLRNWCFIPEELLKEQNLKPSNLLDIEYIEERKPVLKKLINIAKKHLDKALTFSLALPKNYSLRMFCFLPLHFAIQTLYKAKLTAENDINSEIKISRNAVKRTILFTKFSFSSDFIQKKYYNYYRNKLS